MQTVVLSSGREAQVREVSLLVLLSTGTVPNPLLPIIRGAIAGKEVKPEEIEEGLNSVEAIKEYANFFVRFAKTAMVKPKIVDGAASNEDEISLLDLSDTDLFRIFYASQLPAAPEMEAVKNFRAQPNQPPVASADEPDASGEAE